MSLTPAVIPTSSAPHTRRKPKLTYRSPSSSTPITCLRLEGQRHTIPQPGPSRLSSSPESPLGSQSHDTSVSVTKDEPKNHSALSKHTQKLYARLPLYHPLGRLALSLPELGPPPVGVVAEQDTDSLVAGARSSARSRRQAAKIRDADQASNTSASNGDGYPNGHPTVQDDYVGELLPRAPTLEKDAEMTSPPVPTPAPQRRRGGGGKRKRRHADDTGERDLAYRHPSKRATMALLEDGSIDEERRPERRSTRSAKAMTRRDSTASTGSTTVTTKPSQGPNGVNVSPIEEEAVSDSKEGTEDNKDLSGAKTSLMDNAINPGKSTS
jgi:hypothetical protein